MAQILVSSLDIAVESDQILGLVVLWNELDCGRVNPVDSGRATGLPFSPLRKPQSV